MRRLLAFFQIAGLVTLLVGCGSDKSSTSVSHIDQPTGLTASSPTTSTIHLAWTDRSTNEDGFKIRRSSNGQANWADVGVVVANAAAYTDTGLTEATPYAYAVFAFKGTTLSSSSDTASSVTTIRTPTGLAATIQGSTSISLIWTDNSAVETAYKVERKTGSGRFSQIAEIAANSVAFTDTGLAGNTAYSYRVSATKAAIVSDWSNEATATTRFPTPAAPSGLTVTTLGTTSLQITWVDNSSNEAGFKIERAPLGTEDWTLRAPVGANFQSFNDVNLTEGTTYRYRIYAFLENEVSATVGPVEGSTIPAAPLDLRATRETPTTINLVWQDASGSESGFTIERKVAGEAYQVAGTSTANVVTYRDSGLLQNTTYVYRVRADKGSTPSSWSNETSIQTSLLTPTPPSDLFVRCGPAYPNGANLSWTDNSDDEDGFVIEVSANRNNGWAVADTVAPNTIAVVLSGFPSETTRYFRIYAYNEHGQSIYTSPMFGLIYGIPPAPTNAAASSTMGTPLGANVIWTDNSNSEDGFIIESSPNGADNWVYRDSVEANVAAGRVSGLPVESAAYFRVFSFNSAGHSAYSNVASAIVVGPPPAPSDLQGSAPTYFAVELTWQDNSNAETLFLIERSEKDAEFWREIDNVPANSTGYNDSNVVAAHSYDYRIRARNGGFFSAYTAKVNVTTPMRPPGTPTGLTLSDIDIDRIQLSWVDRSNNEDGFYIERRAQDEMEWSVLHRNNPDDAYYLDTLLTPETWYAYRVRAHNEVGYSNFSNADSAQTLSLTMLEEDFESYQVGVNPPDPWVVQSSGADDSARISNRRVHGGSKSLLFTSADEAATQVFAYRPHTPVQKATFTTWLYIEQGGAFECWGLNQALAFTFQIAFSPNDSFLYRDGQGALQGGAYPVNQWFKLNVVFDMDNSSYYIEFNDEVVSATAAIQLADHMPNYHIGGWTLPNASLPGAFMDDVEVIRYWEAPQRDGRSIPKGPVVARLPYGMKLGDMRNGTLTPIQ